MRDIKMAEIETLKDEKDKLLKLIKKEKSDASKLRQRSTDNDFKLLQDGSTRIKWTLEEFLMKNSKDPMLYMVATSTSKLKELEELINATEEVLCVQCDTLTETDKDDMLRYVAKCSFLDTKLQFRLKFDCQNLDSTTVKLVDVKLNDSKQSVDVKPLVDSCIASNNIPMLIQGLASYSELEHARPLLLQQIEKDFGSEVLLCTHHPENGEITLHLVDPNLDEKLLEFKWIIAFRVQKNKFAYGFSMNNKSSGQWLRTEHRELLSNVVNCTEMSEHMVECWRQLCTLVVSKNDAPKKSRNK